MDESQKLDKLVHKTRKVLFEATTVFPFDFFPDTIRVDENKIDIIYRNFFYDKHIVQILIDDIETVVLSSGVIFASIHIQLNKHRPPDLDFFLGKPIKYLWKRDAIRVRRLILGLVMVKKEGIDLTKVATSAVLVKVEEIGKAREYPQV